MRIITLVIVIVASLMGCTEDYSALPQIPVDFSWPGKNVTEISPAIILIAVPEGVKSFEINMYDLTNRYDHGGGTVVNNGSGSIPEGALNKYQGPSPMYGSPRYELSVKAIDENDRVVAFGKKVRKYPPEAK